MGLGGERGAPGEVFAGAQSGAEGAALQGLSPRQPLTRGQGPYASPQDACLVFPRGSLSHPGQMATLSTDIWASARVGSLADDPRSPAQQRTTGL